MDTNLVVPEGARRCRVIFDYFLDAALQVTAAAAHLLLRALRAVRRSRSSVAAASSVRRGAVADRACGLPQEDGGFIERSLEESERVQVRNPVRSLAARLGFPAGGLTGEGGWSLRRRCRWRTSSCAKESRRASSPRPTAAGGTPPAWSKPCIIFTAFSARASAIPSFRRPPQEAIISLSLSLG